MRDLVEKLRRLRRTSAFASVSKTADEIERLVEQARQLRYISGAVISEIERLRSKEQTLLAVIRGEQGIILEDGYTLNVSALRARLAEAERLLAELRDFEDDLAVRKIDAFLAGEKP